MTQLELEQVKSKIYMDLDNRLFELNMTTDGGITLDDVFKILHHQIDRAIHGIEIHSEVNSEIVNGIDDREANKLKG